MNDEKDIDLESLYEYAASNKMKLCDGMMARYISAILLNIDDHHLSEAGDWINKAIEMDKRNGMMWHLGQDYSLYAELFESIWIRKNKNYKKKYKDFSKSFLKKMGRSKYTQHS